MATVLVVDDDLDLRDVIVMALQCAGHEVLLARNGREALHLCRSERPDVVITDVLMPKRSGIELVLALRDLERRPHTIVISGITGDAFLRASHEVGVARAFTKPFDVQALVRAVAELTASGADGGSPA